MSINVLHSLVKCQIQTRSHVPQAVLRHRLIQLVQLQNTVIGFSRDATESQVSNKEAIVVTDTSQTQGLPDQTLWNYTETL